MSKIQEFIKEIEEINKKKTIIKIVEINSNRITILLNCYKLIITCPLTNDEYFIVDSMDDTYNSNLVDINIYCISKKPLPRQLLNVLNKRIGKLKMITKSEPEKEKIDFEVIKYKKIKELEELIESSKSDIVTEKNDRKMYSKHVIGKIIINEYMEIWEKKIYNVEIVNKNIFHWKVKFNKFGSTPLTNSLYELEKKHGYNYIEIDMFFHDILYPNYPPTIKILRPRLMNSLMYRIANIKMVQLDYWDPTRSSLKIIEKVYQLLSKHADIYIETEMNNITKYPNGAFLKLETYLLDLASLVDLGNNDDIDDEKYEKIFSKKIPEQSKKKKNDNTVWKPGTGYGHGSGHTTEWNINAYLNSSQERDKQIQNVLNKIVMEIQDTREGDIIYDAIQQSILIKYLKSRLNETTLLEIASHITLYKIIFILLSNFVNEKAIYLFDNEPNKQNEKSLFDMLTDLNKLCMTAKKFNTSSNDDDDVIEMITNLYVMIKPCYDNYLKTNKEKNDRLKTQEKQISEQDNYVKIMKELQECDKDFKLIGTNYYYQNQFDLNKSHKFTPAIMKRLRNEIVTFNTLPILYDAIIIARTDPNYMTAIRTLITGPKDTPYEGGCFLFDTYVTPEFPSKPPQVWFLNTGNKRFNPNLYDSGKVCLSLLGTWSGDKGSETWHAQNSHLIQIFNSIQSLILVEQPYYNEPGYESTYNTVSGKQKSIEYNYKIKLYTMNHAILDLIKNPKLYPQFEDVIRTHFKLKKKSILETCEKWISDAPLEIGSKYSDLYKKIKVEIEKL